ncbi:MAG TPA: hypothetical protein VGL27_03755 [Negativicutes bacterium]|jgi:hypothetical protein
MRIVEQAFFVKERTSTVKAEYPTDCLFQVFVNGRLQAKGTYALEAETINLGFDCLVPSDFVQLFYFIS